MMVLVNNLIKHGYSPRVFGKVGEQLAAWFAHCQIDAANHRPTQDISQKFDVVLGHKFTAFAQSLSRHNTVYILGSLSGFCDAAPGTHMVDRTVAGCIQGLGLGEASRSNGLKIPEGVKRGAVPSRVVIHPTGSHPEKTWGRSRFLALAQLLTRQNLHASFVVSPAEYPQWQNLAQQGYEVHAFETLDGLATWIAQAGWFIGNDSGPGHLASAIGVPTLSIFMRRGLARSWRPAWGTGVTVVPFNLIPTAKLREYFWRPLLPVRYALHHFSILQRRVSEG